MIQVCRTYHWWIDEVAKKINIELKKLNLNIEHFQEDYHFLIFSLADDKTFWILFQQLVKKEKVSTVQFHVDKTEL